MLIGKVLYNGIFDKFDCLSIASWSTLGYKFVVLKINVTNYTFSESSGLGQFRFAKRIVLLKKFAQKNKNMNLSDNYIICISTSVAVQAESLRFAKNMVF